MRRSSVLIDKKAQGQQPAGLFGHAAICTHPSHAVAAGMNSDLRTLTHNYGHNFTNIPARVPAQGAPVNYATPACLAFPRRCPFGGACHACPVTVQAKLAINQPGDSYEQEADRIADQVIAMPAHSAISDIPPRIQRFPGKPIGQTDIAPASIDRALAGPGRPLGPALQRDMEQHFGFSSILSSQRAIGNDAALRWQQADANQVMSSKPLLQRACACGGKCARCRSQDMRMAGNEETSQTEYLSENDRGRDGTPSIADGNVGLAANRIQPTEAMLIPTERVVPQVEAWIHSRLGLGRPLTLAQRAFFEPRLGRDLGDACIHADADSATLAEGLGARAFTIGRDVFLGAGESAAETNSRLLAHELVHVAQQDRAPALVVQRAETDTRGQCANLDDGASRLDAFVNQKIGEAVAAAVRPTGRGTLPRRPNPMDVVEGTYLRLGVPVPLFPHLTLVGSWAGSNLPHRGSRYFPIGHRYSGYFPIGHRYSGASGVYLRYLAPAVNLNGHCVGIDKIDHMFQQGYEYFLIWFRTVAQFSSSVGQAPASRAGEAFARSWGEWTEGQLSAATTGNPAVMTWLRSGMSGITGLPSTITGARQGIFGLASTGVHSRGDLAANAAGFRFYRDLLQGNVGSFDIARYITADWDEEISGNIFRHDVGEAVRARGRLNPSDVVLP